MDNNSTSASQQRRKRESHAARAATFIFPWERSVCGDGRSKQRQISKEMADWVAASSDEAADIVKWQRKCVCVSCVSALYRIFGSEATGWVRGTPVAPYLCFLFHPLHCHN